VQSVVFWSADVRASFAKSLYLLNISSLGWSLQILILQFFLGSCFAVLLLFSELELFMVSLFCQSLIDLELSSANSFSSFSMRLLLETKLPGPIPPASSN
jgi:hypothetical protein